MSKISHTYISSPEIRTGQEAKYKAHVKRVLNDLKIRVPLIKLMGIRTQPNRKTRQGTQIVNKQESGTEVA